MFNQIFQNKKKNNPESFIKVNTFENSLNSKYRLIHVKLT